MNENGGEQVRPAAARPSRTGGLGGCMRRAAALAALVLLTGCGGSDEPALTPDDGSTSSSLNSQLLNYDESAFALNGDLHANADDIVTLRLEDPSGAYQDDLDTGEEPGVDVIPYYFDETMERRVCWENDPGADPVPSDAAPAFMELRNEADEPVLHVEQDGACVTQLVTAGRYRAVFHHGASARADRDLLFILPQDRDDEASVRRPGVIGESSFDPAPEDLDALAAPVPFCAFGSGPSIGVVARVANPQSGPGCGAVRQLPFELFSLNGACTDVSLFTGRCTYPPQQAFLITTLADSYARVYEDLFFRGPRKTVAGRFPAMPGIQDAFLFAGPASLLAVQGAATHNRDILIRTNGCDQCNLMGVDLHGADLHSAWLRLADLSHADLTGAHLEKIMGEQTLFKSAHLVRAHFDDAYLGGALFDTAGRIEGVDGATYPTADLSSATLTKADLSDAWLVGTTLTNADLTGATAARTNFTGISGVGVIFEDATLAPDVSLRKSTLTRARFTNTYMPHVMLTGAVADGATFTMATMTLANLQGATLTGARMANVKLDQAVLAPDPARGLGPCSLENAYLANADFRSADMTSVKMREARLYGPLAKANGAVLINANLFKAELSGTNFSAATLHNAKLDDAHCVNCSFDGARMAATSSSTNDGASFAGTDLRGASLKNATVSGCDFTNALVSFGTGLYSTGGGGDFTYVTSYRASDMGDVTTQPSVTCPDGRPGPCTSRDRLEPRNGTPTRTPTPTGMRPTWTPSSLGG